MLLQQVKQQILSHEMIQAGDHVITGLSGGPDSVCLLHVLKNLTAELNFTLSAVHVNHGLRGEAADEDQRWVEELCQEWGIPLRCFSFDVATLAREWGISAEEAGRRVRYQAFQEVSASYAGDDWHCCTQKWNAADSGARGPIIPGITGTVKIAIGQNKNDQAETILMRILRGTGTDGLAGIEPVRDGIYLRPLLSVTRAEIEAYCREQHLEPRIDETNLEALYHRNRMRLELLPLLLKEYNPNLLDTLSRMAKNAAEDRDYLRSAATDLIRTHRMELDSVPGSAHSQAIRMPLASLQDLHPAVAKRVITLLLAEQGLTQDVSSVHLEQAIALIQKGEPGAVAEFPRHHQIRIRYGQVEFVHSLPQSSNVPGDTGDRQPNLTFQYPLDPEGETAVPEANAKVLASLQSGTFQPDAMLDHARILSSGLPLLIRNRRSGDWFRPAGMTGRKSLKKLFIDRKVPREKRDLLPILFLGQEALWIPGLGTSGAYQAGADTRQTLHLKFTQCSPGIHSKC